MKKTLILISTAIALLTASCLSAAAWGSIGHQTVVVIAEQHLTKKTRKNIEKLIPYELRNDASWMDKHRKDPEYAYTGSYHTMAMNHDYIYDPDWRMPTGGDCVTGLNFVDYNLTHQDQLHLSDSAKVFNIQILIHIVGDMHCLSHCYVMPEKNQWKCKLDGVEYKYHGFMDHITDILYEGMSIDKIAQKLDKASKKEIEAAQQGSFIDWAQDCCYRDKIIYDINPFYTYDMDPKTVEKAQPAVEDALRTAGYRLAYLLNKYFDY